MGPVNDDTVLTLRSMYTSLVCCSSDERNAAGKYPYIPTVSTTNGRGGGP